MSLPNQCNQLQRTTPTTDDEQDGDITETTNTTAWQKVRGTKRRKTNKVTQSNNPPEATVTTNNRYDLLPNETVNEEETENANTTKKIPRPPPIFVYDVINYPQMINHLAVVTEEENYSTRAMANNIIKINCNSPETYRKMINFMRENNIIFHSYQPRDERAYKIVIKHLHHTVELKDITEELAELGHKVRNIINAKHRQTKEPLNLFFVDLEPANNNKEVYKIRSLQNKIIEIEPPNKSKHIIQCTRCQLHNIKKEHFEQFFSTLGQRFLAGGDYNSKNVIWGSRLTTTKGRELAKLMQNNNYSYISSGTPTYWPTDPAKTPDLLDFFVTKGISAAYTDIVPNFELSSDHTPIITTISSSVITRHNTSRLHNHKTNWEKYREEITNNINLKITLKKAEDLDFAIETLKKVMQQAAIQSTPPLAATTTNKIIVKYIVIFTFVDNRREDKRFWTEW
ncbi:hypothetical protein B7P43_G11362 [Cryptotermes secundus]|uniref:Pre-C2HC domain-containing protein n=1 Tax=Cryptotermes secundus TaxID=105785 RepID=A0A2J7QTB1_9NEOP|nr:hypothetical protein B7P43_G11362 [Cryptotermes secundus]